MEFIEGEPLTGLLEREGTLPPLRAAHIFTQVADALQAAHDLGIVHRDLKPDNIMISRSRTGADVVKVVDFGIAKAVGGDDSQKVTKTGLVVGTPEFMSPEQLAGDKLDGRSDLYSLALVLYKMLTGKLPFEGTTVQETMIKRLTDEPLTLAAARPDGAFPVGLQETIGAALTRNPSERYQSAAKFASDVGAVVGLRTAGAAAPLPATRADDGKTQMLPTPRAAAPPARERRSLVPAIAGALVLLGVGGGYLLYTHRGQARPDGAQASALPVARTDSTLASVAIPTSLSTPERPQPAAKRGIDPTRAAALLDDWFDRIDSLDGATLRDSARLVYDAPGVSVKNRALAAYLVANAFAKLDDRTQGCEWARRAATTDPATRSYAALSQSLCRR